MFINPVFAMYFMQIAILQGYCLVSKGGERALTVLLEWDTELATSRKRRVQFWFPLGLPDTVHWPQCWQPNSGLTRSAGVKICFPHSCTNITPLQACTVPPAPSLLYVFSCFSGSYAVVYDWVNIRDKSERLKSFIQLFRGERANVLTSIAME